ncbi:hypothetical protein AwDysgo_07590 [Bacteroidales bacterium]|nr:hypothetical protein AwDysgo_07590 [Bacteroidales bacterium]
MPLNNAHRLMYKKSQSSTVLNLFANESSRFTGQAAKQFDDPNAWHKQFHTQVTCSIDEGLFSPLFNSSHGAPPLSA